MEWRKGLYFGLQCTLVFATWTVFTASCHWCSKQFFLSYGSYSVWQQTLLVALLTVSKVLFCWCGFHVHIPENTTDSPAVKRLLLTTHFFATFTTNYSFSMMAASSTVTVKLMEPIMTAFLSHFVAKATRVSPVMLVSLVMVCAGAVGFMGNPLASVALSVGTVLVLLSNSLYGLRNVTKKHTSLEVTLLPATHIFYLFLLSGMLVAYSVLRSATSFSPVIFILGASASHVIYSYLSVCIVLGYLGGAVSHAVANIFKRVLVVCILMVAADEAITADKLAWLSLCGFGLLLFNKDRILGINSETTGTVGQHTISRMKNMTQALIVILLGTLAFLAVKQTSEKPKTQYNTINDGSLIRDFTANLNSQNFNNTAQQNSHMNVVNIHPDPQGFDNPKPHFFKEREAWREQTLRSLEWAVGKQTEVVVMNFMTRDSLGEAMMTEGLITALTSLGHSVKHVCLHNQCVLGHIKQIVQQSPAAVLLARMDLQQTSSVTTPFLKNLLHEFGESQRLVFLIRRASEFDTVRFGEITQTLTSDMNVYFLTCDNTLGANLTSHLPLNSAAVADFVLTLHTTFRFMEPIYDIVWLCRDAASCLKETPCSDFPVGYECDARSWVTQRDWRHHVAKDHRERVFVKTYNALFFIQRGRVIITEELDGLLAAMVTDTPVVIVKHKDPNLDNYWREWHAHISDGVRAVEDQSEARTTAIEILQGNSDWLPSLGTFMNPIRAALKAQNPRTCVPAS